MSVARAALGLLVLVLAGCTASVTEIVVVVDSDIPVPAQLDEVHIDVTGVVGGPASARALLSGGGATTLPGTLGVVHTQGPLGPVTVTATGYLRGTAILSRVARTSFVDGRTVVLQLDLLRSCRLMACPTEETCSATGCSSIDVPPSSLPEWMPDAGTSDGAMPPTDAGPSDAGPIDAGAPDSGPRDAGTPDTGAPDAGRTCDAIYGAGMDYVLCSFTPTTCRVAVTTGGGSCDTFCTMFGGTCISADQNATGTPVCTVSGPDTCAADRTSNICVCSR